MTNYLFPNPQELSWDRWAEAAVGFNSTLVNQISASMPWADFAERLGLVVPEAPRPDVFGTWQEWAEALKQATQG